MTEQVTTTAAAVIAASLEDRRAPTRELAPRCALDVGDRGVVVAVDPVRPSRNRVPTVFLERRWPLATRVVARAYHFHARRGRRTPIAPGC